MNSHKFLGLILLIVLGGVALASRTDCLPEIQAQVRQTSEPKTAGPQKWEYCAITDEDKLWEQGFGSTGARVTVTYFELNGRRQENVEYRPGQVLRGGKEQDWIEEARAKALAKLGEEGWELVGVKVTGENGWKVNYLFKRPKP